MTKSSTKGLLGRALASGCAVALAASMAPAAGLSALAATPGAPSADASNYVTVTVQTDDATPQVLLQSYVKLPKAGESNPDVKASNGTVSALMYDPEAYTPNSGSVAKPAFKVATTTSYVTLSEVLKNAGADSYWNSSAVKMQVFQTGATTSTAPGSVNCYEVTPSQFEAGQNWYPNTTTVPASDGSATTLTTDAGASQAIEPCFALNSKVNGLGDNATSPFTVADPFPSRASAAVSANQTLLNNDSAAATYVPMFLHGLSKGDYLAAGKAPAAAAAPANAVPGSFPVADGSSTPEKGLSVTITVPKATGSTQRISGSDWADTMSQMMTYNSAYQAGAVKNFVIATAGGYQDALAASGLAGAVTASGTAWTVIGDTCAPVLMTEGGQLTPQTAALLNYYGARSGSVNVYVVGGKMAISDEVVASIKALDAFKNVTLNVERIKGDEAWDTSLAVRNFIVEKASTTGWEKVNTGIDGKNAKDTAIICTSGGFQDALSIAPFAYNAGIPIVLTNSESVLAPDAAKLMGRLENAFVIGGRKAVAAEVTDSQLLGVSVKRVYGESCYDTSNQVATELYDKTGAFGDITTFNGSVTAVGVATGENYLDALASSSFCGNVKTLSSSATGAMPILLVSNDDLTTVNGFLATNAANNTAQNGKFTTAKVFGGAAAINASAFSAIQAALI